MQNCPLQQKYIYADNTNIHHIALAFTPLAAGKIITLRLLIIV